MAHTPGPWRVADYTENAVSPKLIVQAGVDVEVAAWFLPTERDAANAKLIAAAPDLLAACKAQEEAEAHHRTCENCDTVTLCMDAEEKFAKAEAMRKAAIAKAEGRA